MALPATSKVFVMTLSAFRVPVVITPPDMEVTLSLTSLPDIGVTALAGLFTLLNPTSDFVVFVFKVLVEVNVVPPTCSVPAKVPLEPVKFPLKDAFPVESIENSGAVI